MSFVDICEFHLNCTNDRDHQFNNEIGTLKARLSDAEAVNAEQARKLGEWRCFHCGDSFAVEQEARDHFAIEGVPPMCVDPLTKDEKTRMVVVRKLEAEIINLRKENEELDHMAGCLKAIESELSRYFGTCGGTPVKTASQAFLVYEAMIGRAEAAESRCAALESELTAMRVERDEAKRIGPSEAFMAGCKKNMDEANALNQELFRKNSSLSAALELAEEKLRKSI